jgi:hypothetical protein
MDRRAIIQKTRDTGLSEKQEKNLTDMASKIRSINRELRNTT